MKKMFLIDGASDSGSSYNVSRDLFTAILGHPPFDGEQRCAYVASLGNANRMNNIELYRFRCGADGLRRNGRDFRCDSYIQPLLVSEYV